LIVFQAVANAKLPEAEFVQPNCKIWASGLAVPTSVEMVTEVKSKVKVFQYR